MIMLTMIKARGKQVNYNNYLNTTLLGRLSENLVPGFYTNRTNVIFGRDMRCKASSFIAYCALFGGTFCYAHCHFTLVT